MEKQVIAAILLLVIGLLGVGHLLAPSEKYFKGLSFEDKARQKFEEFQWKYNKVYNDDQEQEMRFQIFNKTLALIEKFNSEKHNSTVGINKFADLTDKEFSKYLLKQEEQTEFNLVKQTKFVTVSNRPTKADWRGQYVWEGVYNQGECGSCWAFSALQGLEAIYAKTTGKFRQLSVQQIIDCASTPAYSNDGCHGGLAPNAYRWAKDNYLCAKEDYPVQQYQEKKLDCRQKECTPLMLVSGHTQLPQNNKDAILNQLAQHPVSVSVQASLFAFKYYTGGIIDSTAFGGATDHAVFAVGYDEAEGYIRGKNSWFEDNIPWGENGYFRVKIQENGQPGTVGIYRRVTFPIMKQ